MNAERRPTEEATSQRAGQPEQSLDGPTDEDPKSAPYASAAEAYRTRGWHPIPVLDGGKGEVPRGFTGYQGKLPAPRLVTTWSREHPDANISLRLVGCVGLDVDSYDEKVGADTLKDLVAELGELPPTVRVSSRFGSQYDGFSGIRVFRLPQRLVAMEPERVWRSQWKDVEVIRFGHRQAVVWPSRHPKTGATYLWMDESTGGIHAEVLPPLSELPELPEAWCQALLRRTVGAGRPRRNTAGTTVDPVDGTQAMWWTPGEPCRAVKSRLEGAEAALHEGRHDAARAGVLALTRLGEQGHQGVRAAMAALRESFLSSVQADDSRGAHEAGAEWDRLVEGVSDEITQAGLTEPSRRGCCDPCAVAVEREWPTPVPFQIGSAVPFPTDALPARMGAAVREVSEAVQVDPVIPATAFLGVAAGLVGAQTAVHITPTWQRVCNLYLVVVVETGGGKSPGMEPAVAPIVELEQELRTAAELERRRADVLLPGIKDQLKKGARGLEANELDVLVSEKAELERASSRSARLMVDDTTPERLAALMADNGGRIIAWNDEGSMLKHALGLYAKTPNLDLFLKSWDGTRYVQDRKGGGGAPVTEVVLQHPALTLVAAVQPTTIKAVGGSGNGELVERGLVGRMLIAWPPSRTGTRLLSDRNVRGYRQVQVWNDEVVRLARVGARELAFSPEAGRIFMAWHDEVEVQLPAGKVYADVREFAVKTRDSVARIAGLLARLDEADQVSSDHVARAIRLGEYYLAHAQTVIESWAGNEVAIAQKILAKADKPAFTVRDATRWVRGHKVEEIVEALEVLEARGYVRAADEEIGFGTGRRVGGQSPVVLLNPAVPLLPPVVPVVPGSKRSEGVEERD